MKRILSILFFIQIFTASGSIFAQQANSIYFGPGSDPCGYDETRSQEMYKILGLGWGYNYDSLLTDLDKWASSPFVMIDSIGASVENRAIWRLTITDTSSSAEPRTRISIHTRTHPNEVQSTWVTNEIIKILMDSSNVAQTLRNNCIFNIIPMYNPDGVELGNGRTNANDVDLEREWDSEIMEPEAAALKKTFETYMASESPVRIALNMHSAYSCTRFFVYHDETGTSKAFAEDQADFITGIRAYWPEGIQNWDYYISWVNSTPTHFPESWFWWNFREGVMALTYEDMNCSEAGDFDKTALALLSGIKDYLGLQETPVEPIPFVAQRAVEEEISLSAYPNPVSNGSKLSVNIRLMKTTEYELAVYNILGQRVASIYRGTGTNGITRLSTQLSNISTGMYYLSITSEQQRKTIPILVVP